MMTVTVCLSAYTLHYLEGGGHTWVYLNWALGLRALGCRVTWLEGLHPDIAPDRAQELIVGMKARLEPYGLADNLAVISLTERPLSPTVAQGCLGMDAALEADLLINLRYDAGPEFVRRFRRSALVDIDPGLLQTWMVTGKIQVAPHHIYFTTGETVGQPGARFPDAGVEWHYTPPCVALDWWRPHPAKTAAPFTTVSHWSMEDWEEDDGDPYRNSKREGFLPFLDLPRHTSQKLELALCLATEEEDERLGLQARGWAVRDAHVVTSTPEDYQRYIQESRGEFSCVKPSCVRRQNAWISDRTLCYLASAKPAIVQHTGASRFLPDTAGLFRFRDLREAVRFLEMAAIDYEQQCRLARALAEEHFDARRVVSGLLERALA